MSTHDPFAVDDTDTDTDTVASLAAAGLTASEIGERVSISEDVIRSHPDYIGAALGTAHDARVERALYERAVGSITWAESITKLGERVTLRRSADPDVAAAKLYLQARAPARWGAAAQEQGARVYVVALPPVAANSTEWLAGIARDAAAARVIEHAPATGGGPQAGRGWNRSNIDIYPSPPAPVFLVFFLEA